MTVNTPRAMFERLAFACFLALLVASIGLLGPGLLFSLHAGEFRPALLGVAGLLIFFAIRPFGYKHLHFREWEDSLEPVECDGAFALNPAHDARARHFAALIEGLENLRQRAAAGEADVWEVQALRHRAALLLAADPALRARFASELAGHPELG